MFTEIKMRFDNARLRFELVIVVVVVLSKIWVVSGLGFVFFFFIEAVRKIDCFGLLFPFLLFHSMAFFLSRKRPVEEEEEEKERPWWRREDTERKRERDVLE